MEQFTYHSYDDEAISPEETHRDEAAATNAYYGGPLRMMWYRRRYPRGGPAVTEDWSPPITRAEWEASRPRR